MSRSTGVSPFELLIGKVMRLKDDVELKRIIEDETIREMQEKRDALRERAKQTIENVQKENQRTYNKKRKRPKVHSIGDLVAIKRVQVAPGSKLQPKYLGPYQISDILRGDRYAVNKIGEHEGPCFTITAADNIKKWTSGLYDLSDQSSDNHSDDNNAETEGQHRGPMLQQDGRDVGPRSPVFTRARARRSKQTQ